MLVQLEYIVELFQIVLKKLLIQLADNEEPETKRVSRNQHLLIAINELSENFELLDDWEDKYRYLIDLGEKLPPLEEIARTLQLEPATSQPAANEPTALQ